MPDRFEELMTQLDGVFKQLEAAKTKLDGLLFQSQTETDMGWRIKAQFAQDGLISEDDESAFLAALEDFIPWSTWKTGHTSMHRALHATQRDVDRLEYQMYAITLRLERLLPARGFQSPLTGLPNAVVHKEEDEAKLEGFLSDGGKE